MKEAKKYLINERQLTVISENIMNEHPENFQVGDYVQLLEPIEPINGMDVPVQTPFKILHIDSENTLRVKVDGIPDPVALCPDVDQVIKSAGNGLVQEMKEPVTRKEWVGMSGRQFSDLLDPLQQAKGKRYIIKVVKHGYKYYLTDNGERDQITHNAPRQYTTNIKDAVSSDNYQLMHQLMYGMLTFDIDAKEQLIELVDRLDSKNNVRMNGAGEKI